MCFLWFGKKKKNKKAAEAPATVEAAPVEKVEEPAPEEKEAPTLEIVEEVAPAAEAKVEETPEAAPEKETKPAPKAKPQAPKAKTAETATPKKAVKAAPTEEKDPEAAEKEAPFTGKFEINKTKDGKKYFFNLYASNKVGIATSQMYASAQSAMIGIKSVMNISATAPVEDQTLKTYETLPYPKWEIYLDNGEKYRFRLNAANGSCVCHSQGYTTKNACKNGIDSIIRSSRNPEIEKTYLQKKETKENN